jgi:hypothetical protein
MAERSILTLPADCRGLPEGYAAPVDMAILDRQLDDRGLPP